MTRFTPRQAGKIWRQQQSPDDEKRQGVNKLQIQI
jgi:hypothetical protein